MIKNNKKGFTIVELVIVIAVIGILAAVLIPTFNGIINKAEESKSLQETRNTLTEYISQNSTANAGMMFYYPTNETASEKTFTVYLYANGALNNIGTIVCDNNYVVNLTKTKLADGVAYVEKETPEGGTEVTVNRITFTKTYGSYTFNGWATFKADMDGSYGEAFVAKESYCTQATTDAE